MPCKVVHLTSVHYAFDNRIFHKECTSLASAGYAVTLIAPNGDGDLVSGGVRLRALTPPRNRFERATRTIPQIYHAALDEDAAIYHYHDPELMPVGGLLRLLGKKVIYDVHEDYSGSMAGKQWIPKQLRGFASFAVRCCENLFAGRCNRVIAATPIIAKKLDSPNVRIVQNFPWIRELRSQDNVSYAERESIVAYVGALSNDRGLIEMSAAIEEVATRLPVRLLTAGTIMAGAEAGRDQSSLVEHMGLLTRPQVAGLLARSRVGIVTLHPTQNYVNSQPTKLYEYMSAGIPVVASDFPLWRQVIESAGCGLLVDPLDPRAIADALEWLLRHPIEAEEMGRRGYRAVIERYNWEREADCLIEVYSDLTAAEVSS